MNNEKTDAKRKVGAIVLDIITIGLLFAAFGMVFYAGFITEEEDLTLNVMSAVTAAGLILLYIIGTCSCLVTRVKQKALTAGFLAFSAVQLYALLSNLVVLGCLLIGLFTVNDVFMQAAYVVTTGIVLLGYVVNVIAFSDNNVPAIDEDDESDEDEEEEEASDDDSEDELKED